MSATTGIEWTDATWNPVTGCMKVSPGCDHCYAERITERFHGKGAFATVQLHEDRLDIPLRWRKPRRVFVNSMSDLFHDSVPDEFIARVFAVMGAARNHTFQLLTKRHGRMRSLLSSEAFVATVMQHGNPAGAERPQYSRAHAERSAADWIANRLWPLPNVWLGVSVENQQWADIRVPALLDTPAAVRFLSCEPLLGPVDLNGPAYAYGHRSRLTYWLTGRPGWGEPEILPSGLEMQVATCGPRIDWVIVGGESGPGARPMHPAWARQLRDQCTAADVPFLLKQWGEWVIEDQSPEDITLPGVCDYLLGNKGPCFYRVGKKAAGRELDGRTWDQYPAEVST